MTERTVMVRLRADAAQYQGEMRDSAKATTEVDRAQRAAQVRSKMWGAVGLASRVAGAGVAAGLLYATKAASEQEQAIGALSAVHKTAATQMKANAAAAVQIGLSQTQYGNAAAKLGAQLKNLGIEESALAGTTDGLIKAGADMAAQFGGTTAQAVDAISAAMRKERDPIEAYGVTLTDAGIKAEMAATGMDELHATLSLLSRQLETSGTTGALSREFDSAAASSQRAQAAFDNAAAGLGQALLPAVTQAAEVATRMMEAFNGLPQPLKTTATAVGVLAAALLLVGPRASAAVTSLRELRSAAASGDLAAGWVGTAGKIAAVGAAAIIAIPLVQQMFDAVSDGISGSVTSDLDLLQQQIVAFSRTGSGEIGRFGASITGLGDAFAQNASVFDQWVRLGPFNSALNSAEGEIQSVDHALAQLVSGGRADEAAAAVVRFQQSTTAAGGSAEDVTGALPKYAAALEASRLASENSAAASGDDAAAKAKQAAAVRALTRDLQTFIGLNLARSGSADALIGQVQRLSAAVRENGATVRGHSQAAVANREAARSELSLILALGKATQDRVSAARGEQAGLAAGNKIIASRVGQLRANAAAAGLSKQAFDAYLRSLGVTPSAVTTAIRAQGLDDAKTAVSSYRSSLAAIPEVIWTTVQVKGGGTYRDNWAVGRAGGGLVTGPGSSTSDSIAARLSHGEYVVRAAAVRRYGVDALQRVNAGTAAPGFADGGFASWATRALPASWRTGLDAQGMAELARWIEENIPHLAGNRTATSSLWSTTPPPRPKRGGKDDDEYRTAITNWRQRVKAWNEEHAAIKKQFALTVRREKLDRRYEALQAAADKVAQVKQARSDYAASVADGLQRSLSALSAFDFDAQTAAIDRRVSAEQSWNEAMAAVNTAAPGDRAKAVKALVEAEVELAAAREDEAKAAPTTANVLASFADQAARAEAYAAKVTALRDRGLSMSVLDEIANASPAQAGGLIDALSAMSAAQISQVNAAQGRVAAAGNAVGGSVATALFGRQQATAEDALKRVQVTVTPRFTIEIDGRQVAAAVRAADRRAGRK